MSRNARTYRRLIVVPSLFLSLVLAGCGGSGSATSAASAASNVGAGLAAQASAVQSAASSPATSASSAATTPASSATTASSASSAATASSASSAATSAGSAATTVLVKTDPKLGQLLTDPSGRTLYWYTKDKPGTSNCSGGCLAVWPPFTTAGTLTLPSGVPGKLTTITRTDGSTQVAYDDMPLYYYAKDANPGDTVGQGVGKVWYVVAPTAGPLTPPSA